MDRGAWWATVHEVRKSQTRLSGESEAETILQNYNKNMSQKRKSKCFLPLLIAFSFYLTFWSLRMTIFRFPGHSLLEEALCPALAGQSRSVLPVGGCDALILPTPAQPSICTAQSLSHRFS